MKIGLGGLPADDLTHVVKAVQHRAQGLADSRILVTGASGFVGRWIVASLTEIKRQMDLPGMSVQLLVRDPVASQGRLGGALWGEVEVIHADINSDWSLPAPITHAVHGATPSSVRSGSGDARSVLVTSIMGTQSLIRSISECENKPRVLNLSSGAVYGPQPAELPRIPETWSGGPSPFQPTTPYAEGKRAAEALLEAASREGLVDPIQARLFAFLGPGLPTDEGFAIGNFVGQASRGETITVHGDGTTVRSYLDARDLVAWLILLLVSGEASSAYNIGSPEGRPLTYWAYLCSELSGVGTRIGDAPVGERSIYVPEVSKSEQQDFYIDSRDPRDAIESWMKWLILKTQPK